MQDSDIVIDDDAPAWTPEMFSRALAHNGLEHSLRQQVVPLSIDADVFEWFQAQSHDHLAHINTLLRAYMQDHRQSTNHVDR